MIDHRSEEITRTVMLGDTAITVTYRITVSLGVTGSTGPGPRGVWGHVEARPIYIIAKGTVHELPPR